MVMYSNAELSDNVNDENDEDSSDDSDDDNARQPASSLQNRISER